MLTCSPFLGQRELDFSGFIQGGVLVEPPDFISEIDTLLPIRTMLPKFIVVYTPILHLFAGIRKGQEPVLVRHSARKRPLSASMNALSVGLPGREKSKVTPLA